MNYNKIIFFKYVIIELKKISLSFKQKDEVK